MLSTVKKVLSLLKKPTGLINAGQGTTRSTTCPPPGATNIKTIYIFCFYTDINGNRGWCML